MLFHCNGLFFYFASTTIIHHKTSSYVFQLKENSNLNSVPFLSKTTLIPYYNYFLF